MVTVSLVLVAQEWGDDDGASFSHTHAQQADVHAFDQVTLANVRVIRLRPGMAAAEGQRDPVSQSFPEGHWGLAAAELHTIL